MMHGQTNIKVNTEIRIYAASELPPVQEFLSTMTVGNVVEKWQKATS
jgi:hypothetical protein